jgi:hypothetical protein
VQRLQAAGFEKLHLAHFGTVDAVGEHCAEYLKRIQQVVEVLRTQPIADEYTKHEANLAESFGVSPEQWAGYELANGTTMCAQGILRYLTKSNPPTPA